MREIKDLFVAENGSIKEAMRVIDKGGLNVAMVVDDSGVLKGVVTDGNIRTALREGADINSPVSEIMYLDPVSMKEGESKEKVLEKIRSRGFPKFYSIKMPVVDDLGRVKNIAISFVGSGKLHFLNEEEEKGDVKKVLVVGGAGYLGSILCRKLLGSGYKVRALDSLMFGEEATREMNENENFELIRGDMRNIITLTKSLEGVDAVILLAAIVGDPAGMNQPADTIETNYLGTMALAQACKYHQINRFIFASTCSVYGTGSEILDEESDLSPISLYARSKIEAEKGILTLVDENFSPTILRMGTLHGLSERMRFDLVINKFAMLGSTGQDISIWGGEQWRPFLHIEDAAEAYKKCLEAPMEKVRGQVFNVGSDDENYQIRGLGPLVKEMLPWAKVNFSEGEVTGGKEDKRDYRVSFKKIETLLGFRSKYGVKKSILDIHNAIKSGKIGNVGDSKYYNAE